MAGGSKRTKINPTDIGTASSGIVTYDDLQVSIGRVKLGSSAPTWRSYDHGIGSGVDFDVLGFAVNNFIFFNVQTSHSQKLLSILDNHIHYTTPTDGSGTPDKFKFQLDVIAAPIDGNWAVPSGSPFTKEHIIDADYSNMHKLLELADIPAVNSTVSTIYKCKLTRIAASGDEYAGEVYIEFTDCHAPNNTFGSLQEDSKA